MGQKSIGRPFILYNDFLPPTREIHTTWECLSFGYYDGVTVGNNLFDENGCNLRKVWEHYIRHGQEMDGSFSSQVIIGMRNEEDEEAISDESFWKMMKESSEYPFLFISLIQIKREKGILEKGWKHRKEFEKALNKHDYMKGITYVALDNSDMVLALLCKTYSDGTRFIDSLHCGAQDSLLSIMKWTLSYSFTIATVNKKILNEDKAVAEVKGEISKVYIHVIEKHPGSIDLLQDELKKQLGISYVKEKTSILGCNDELIVLEKVPWNQFLLLYQDAKGILNHSNETYGENLIGVTTIISEEQKRCCQPKEVNQEKNKEGTGGNPEIVSAEKIEGISKQERMYFSTVMRQKCRNMVPRGGKTSVCIEKVQRNLYQVINSLHKFETTPFSDYLFQTGMFPVNMVLDMFGEISHDAQLMDYFESFYEFMKGFNLYVQNWGRSDRQFTQMPDFNARFFDTPIKLNAFYNAFIFKLKQFLGSLDEGGVGHEYEFLACPGAVSNMRVLELFRSISQTKRLFLVEIPENQIYNPKMMMTMLSHEVGHFVGTNIRSREERFDFVKKILARIIVSYMRVNLANELGNNEEELGYIQNPEYWNRSEERLKQLLDSHTDEKAYKKYLGDIYTEISSDEQDMFRKLMMYRRYHSNVLQKFLADRIRKVMQKYRRELWEYVVEKDFLYWVRKGEKYQEKKRVFIREKFTEWSENFCMYHVWNRDTVTLYSVIGELMLILKECIADLMGILVLEIPMYAYLETIIQSTVDQGIEKNLTNTAVIIRAGLVTYCMSYTSERKGMGYVWTDDDLREINKKGSEEMIDLKNTLLKFIKEYLKINDVNKMKEMTKVPEQALEAFLDGKVLFYVRKYLLTCKERFARANTEEKAEDQKKLINIYRMFDHGGCQCPAIELNNYVENYLYEIQEQISRYVEENSEI